MPSSDKLRVDNTISSSFSGYFPSNDSYAETHCFSQDTSSAQNNRIRVSFPLYSSITAHLTCTPAYFTPSIFFAISTCFSVGSGKETSYSIPSAVTDRLVSVL